MTYRRQIGTLLFVGGLVAHGPAGASITPAERCTASELTAVGKLAKASLACHATTATKGMLPAPCLTKATAAFEKTWGVAEARGGCGTTATVTDAEAEVGGVVAAAVGEITGTPEDALLTTPAAQACAARKLAATGKNAKALLACDARGVNHGTPSSSPCVDKAGGALMAAWGAAETKGGCVTVGDSEGLNINGLSLWGIGHLGGTLTTPSCGTFVTAWGSAGSESGQFNSPVAVAVDGSGNVFVSDDVNFRVQKFDNNGTFLTTWDLMASVNPPTINRSAGVAVDGSGNVFVVDVYGERIQKFDSSGTFLLTFGWGVKDGAAAFEICTSGCQSGLAGLDDPGPGQFTFPRGIGVDGSGNVFVTDIRVQEFTNAGTFVADGLGGGFVQGLGGIAVDGSGNFFDADMGEFRVQKYDNSWRFLLTFGWGVEDGAAVFEICRPPLVCVRAGLPGSGNGQFGGRVGNTLYLAPQSVAVDGSGNVYVSDAVNDRIQVFDNDGNFRTAWGSSGSGDGQFSGPNGIAVDGSGNVFVADVGNKRVQKFACPIPPPIQPPPCKGINQSCSANGECCSNFCQGQALVCDCFTTGDDCRQGPQSCCSGACDPQTGFCL